MLRGSVLLLALLALGGAHAATSTAEHTSPLDGLNVDDLHAQLSSDMPAFPTFEPLAAKDPIDAEMKKLEAEDGMHTDAVLAEVGATATNTNTFPLSSLSSPSSVMEAASPTDSDKMSLAEVGSSIHSAFPQMPQSLMHLDNDDMMMEDTPAATAEQDDTADSLHTMVELGSTAVTAVSAESKAEVEQATPEQKAEIERLQALIEQTATSYLDVEGEVVADAEADADADADAEVDINAVSKLLSETEGHADAEADADAEVDITATMKELENSDKLEQENAAVLNMLELEVDAENPPADMVGDMSMGNEAELDEEAEPPRLYPARVLDPLKKPSRRILHHLLHKIQNTWNHLPVNFDKTKLELTPEQIWDRENPEPKD